MSNTTNTSVSPITKKKIRKSISEDLMYAGIQSAQERKLSLKAFVTEFCEKNGYNPDSVSQKYYKWRTDLRQIVDNPTESDSNKAEAKTFLQSIELVDGRFGSGGGGRPKLNRLQSLAEIKAKLFKKTEDNTTVENNDVETNNVEQSIQSEVSTQE